MFSKIAKIAALSLSLSGCATVKNNYVPVTTQISFPRISEIRTATLGDQLIAQGTATTTEGVTLNVQNPIGPYTLNPGFYPKTGEDKEYIFTSFSTGSSAPNIGTITINNTLLSQGSFPQGIRFHKEKQQTCIIAPNIYGFNQPSCDTEYSYQFTEEPIVSANNFQQTLIYSGRVGDKIRISYREFSGNLARPAFSNEAEYDLGISDEIAYKGAKLRIINADNQSIEYEVISNFNLE